MRVCTLSLLLGLLCPLASARAGVDGSADGFRTSDGRLWGGDAIAAIQAPFEMPQLARPVFPDRVVDIRDHGAVEGGEVKNTQAIAAAIATCAEAGGGRVLVPAGRWLTGPIHLQSNIELHLAEGAEVVFSDRFEDYLPVVLVRVGGIEIYNYSPLVYARDCENIAITGPGRLNGNARAWWAWQKKETRAFFDMGAAGVPVEQRVFGTPEAAIRPSFVVFFGCRNVLMEGFTIGGGPNWTVHPVYCENTIIRRVHVLTDGPNNDGVDPDSCRNMLIEHCVFDTGDDCVVLKSGYNEDGWRVARPTENVVMRWCSSKRGHGGLVIGSEMSGDVRNVYMHDCEFEGTDRAVRIKSRRGRGAVVENVWAENLRVKDMQREVVIMNMDYSSDTKALTNEKAPLFRNITIRNVVGDGAPTAILLSGLEDSLIQGIRFENVSIRATAGVVCRNVSDVRFDRVEITPTAGPAFDLANATKVAIAQARATAGTSVFLKVSDARSRDITIASSDLAGAARVVELGEGVPTDAVGIASSPEVVSLWPEGVPGLHADAAEEQVVNGRIVGVHRPSMLVFRPDPAVARSVETAVVFCPGGGYHHLTIGENGGPDTRWLNRLGVTVCVLKYRMLEYGHPAPLQDVLRAVRIVRSRAAGFGVRPDRIGVLGASAGGHLAGCAATLWEAPEGRTGAALDAVSARPDFAMLVYPVISMDPSFAHMGSRRNLIGESPTTALVEHLSLEKQVRPDTPPVFLVATMADRSVPVENTLRFYAALREAGVPAEVHVYAQGSHGNSLDPQFGPTAHWPDRATEWLRFNGWLTPPVE